MQTSFEAFWRWSCHGCRPQSWRPGQIGIWMRMRITTWSGWWWWIWSWWVRSSSSPTYSANVENEKANLTKKLWKAAEENNDDGKGLDNQFEDSENHGECIGNNFDDIGDIDDIDKKSIVQITKWDGIALDQLASREIAQLIEQVLYIIQLIEQVRVLYRASQKNFLFEFSGSYIKIPIPELPRFAQNAQICPKCPEFRRKVFFCDALYCWNVSPNASFWREKNFWRKLNMIVYHPFFYFQCDHVAVKVSVRSPRYTSHNWWIHC